MISEWAVRSAKVLIKKIELILKEKSECNIVLTGGNSAFKLYSQLACDSNFYALRGLNFYFSDERCVDIGHADSNCRMAIDALFSSGIPNDWSIFPINGSAQNRDEEASRYSKLVPNDLDILLLGVGSDGHIASIFPKSNLLHDFRRLVVSVSASHCNLHDRFTFTPQLIAQAHTIYLLASTESKRIALMECQDLSDPELKSMPVKFLMWGQGGFEGRREVNIL